MVMFWVIQMVIPTNPGPKKCGFFGTKQTGLQRYYRQAGIIPKGFGLGLTGGAKRKTQSLEIGRQIHPG